MSFLDFFKTKREEEMFFDIFLPAKAEELRIKELMIEHAIDLIAKTIAKSEIHVFRNKKGKITKQVDDVYYTLNVRPNANQDGTTFIYNIVAKLLRENEALVVRLNSGDLFLADRFSTTDDIIKGKIYHDIYIYDDNLNEIALNKRITADDAVFLSLGDSQIKKVLDSFYADYAEMISASVSGYKRSNFKKYKLELPVLNQPLRDATTRKEIDLKDYVNKIAGDLLKNEDSIVALSETFGLDVVGEESVRSSEDTREMIRDFGNKVAMAFNIPLDIYYGSKTDKSTGTNDFITFAVMPILSIVEDAFNAKLISKQNYLMGERIKFDKFTMKHFDITDVAGSLDKLFAIGWSHNDLREIIGLPLIEEEWANRHHVTKNYMNVNGESSLEGGE